eukprot:TRINITY_DN14762_c0_g1_i12.p1 TRINITY_DN14762_c0_g1~~TRINITY_DN14762_c0_g1_i12.p1  ORF type:complete len:891 (-),score=86.97 TRINITY_DN14762_c0_g1_i12:109-2781(-)
MAISESAHRSCTVRTSLFKHKGVDYIVKGFTFDSYKSQFVDTELKRINEEYFFMEAICGFSPHFTRPLFLDYVAEPGLHFHVEILFEYTGMALNDLKSLDVKALYNFMQQSANALLLLHNIGLAHSNIRPDCMICHENTLRFVNMGSAFSENRLNSEAHKMEELRAMDVYLWAMCFTQLSEGKELMTTENAGIVNSTKVNMKAMIKMLLKCALKPEAEERPTMKEILDEMKNFKAANSPKEVINRGLKYRVCMECSGDEEVELSCGHAICKDHLGETVLKKFLSKAKYKYVHFCCQCNSFQKLQSLLLDCGCLWIKFKEEAKLGNIVACKRNHVFSLLDMCLIKDYISFKVTSMAIIKYLTKKIDPILYRTNILKSGVAKLSVKHSTAKVKLNLRNLGEQISTVISEVLKASAMVTALTISNCRLANEDAKAIREELGANTALTQLIIKNTELQDNAYETIIGALGCNRTLESMSLIFSNRVHLFRSDTSKVSQSNETLKKLALHGRNFNYETNLKMLKAVRSNKRIEHLVLKKMACSKIVQRYHNEGNIICIGKALKANKTLKMVKLDNNILRDKGGKALGEAIKLNKSIVTLQASRCGIGKEGTEVIIEALRVNKMLAELNLEKSNIGKETTKILSEVLTMNRSLKGLDMSNSRIRDNDIELIRYALKINRSLIYLNLAANKIRFFGAEAIFEALMHNKAIEKLDLSSNEIEGRCVGMMLKVNKTLRELNLSENYLGVEGTETIAEALRDNTTLTSLNLSCNAIRNEGALAIGYALKCNSTLKNLQLNKNAIRYIENIGEALRTNKGLKVLDLTKNLIDNKGVKAISKGLKSNTTLVNLYLGENQIEDEGADALIEALKINRTLREFTVWDNKIGQEKKRELENLFGD